MPSETEIQDAYRSGKLPRWVEHYANTGEVLTDDELRDRANKPAQKTPEPQKGKGLLNRVLGK